MRLLRNLRAEKFLCDALQPRAARALRAIESGRLLTTLRDETINAWAKSVA